MCYFIHCVSSYYMPPLSIVEWENKHSNGPVVLDTPGKRGGGTNENDNKKKKHQHPQIHSKLNCAGPLSFSMLPEN